jgi:leucyl-tRNA synthetase
VIDGKGWRSGAVVEKKELNQWFLNITKYSDQLLKSLDQLKRLARKSKVDAKKLDRKICGLRN